MEKRRIYNIYQADFLINKGCIVLGAGLQGRVYIEFLVNKDFDKYMEIWRTRKH
ncbi:TPA: hypothetical protein N2D16_004001 [Clostridium botulinum]|nr:hypothetical protein [Clostridium botulinum]